MNEVFYLKTIVEKYVEKNRDVCVVLMDLGKMYNRDGNAMWITL